MADELLCRHRRSAVLMDVHPDAVPATGGKPYGPGWKQLVGANCLACDGGDLSMPFVPGEPSGKIPVAPKTPTPNPPLPTLSATHCALCPTEFGEAIRAELTDSRVVCLPCWNALPDPGPGKRRSAPPADVIVDGMVGLCPKCRRAIEGTAAWTIDHRKTCDFVPPASSS